MEEIKKIDTQTLEITLPPITKVIKTEDYLDELNSRLLQLEEAQASYEPLIAEVKQKIASVNSL